MVWRPGFVGAGDGGHWVVLDVTLTDDLIQEGLARELVHQIQQMRKEAGLDIADRITVYYDRDTDLIGLLSAHREYVIREVLALDVRPGAPLGDGPVHWKTIRLDGRDIRLGIAQVPEGIRRR